MWVLAHAHAGTSFWDESDVPCPQSNGARRLFLFLVEGVFIVSLHS